MDLQPDIVKACASNHMSGATKEKLALQTFMDSTEIRFMHLLLRLMETDSVSFDASCSIHAIVKMTTNKNSLKKKVRLGSQGKKKVVLTEFQRCSYAAGFPILVFRCEITSCN